MKCLCLCTFQLSVNPNVYKIVSHTAIYSHFAPLGFLGYILCEGKLCHFLSRPEKCQRSAEGEAAGCVQLKNGGVGMVVVGKYYMKQHKFVFVFICSVCCHHQYQLSRVAWRPGTHANVQHKCAHSVPNGFRHTQHHTHTHRQLCRRM